MTLENLLDEVQHEVQHLPDTDKWRLVRHLLNELEGTKTETREDWRSFVNRMYGALADDPIELPLTEREPVD